MKTLDKLLLSSLCLSSLVIMACCQPTDKAAADVGFKNFVQGVNDIESKLGKSLSSKTENSVVCVPSAQILLGLCYAGARGKTASELEALFGVNDKQLETLAYFEKFVAELQVPEVKIANTAYIAKDITLKKEFLEQGQKYFNITVNQADFSKKEETAKTINAWVESKTERLIKELIKKDDISDDAKLILLNAIYFKGKWQKQFKAHSTMDSQFKVTKTQEITVKQMSQVDHFPYAEDADYQYLVMPYEGNKLSMLIVLPKDHETFEKKDISKMALNSLQFQTHRVQVMMPKFKVESTIDWGSILKDKIPSAFSNSADLSGISDTALKVSKMIQKAYIKVDEKGTEAAAATAMMMCAMSAPGKVEMPKPFIVDRPFYYALRIEVKSAHAFLFQGPVVKPKA